ncbi:prephenate dehydrogenase [Arenicella xantha]|uniref:prephenate dehydrogenase n=1 Tax=Arenicella xantha TaxID=644221 RepID=A0A395JPH2_9GAMM|nr:prephenate dehydrogenase/arogenate dehydrogenase family protein [Arenicella xantha]RBP51478.1 prephenate dehydrogenase [Arenicella xantha]
MFNQVTIIGTGLLGGSLARDLKALSLAQRVVGVCRSDETAKTALSQGIVDAVLPLHEAIVAADLIVLATPMQAMGSILKQMEGRLPKQAIVTDVGSVKTDLYQAIKLQVPSMLAQFVLAHPIAGGENSGVEASKLGLFKNKHVIITETDEVSQAAVAKVTQMWEKVGAMVLAMSLQEHDAVFAKTSHLPHVIAFSLVNFLSHQSDRERLFDLAAAGFYDFTRIASSNAEMWRDICITNRAEVLKALDGFSAQIEAIRDNVASADQAAILEYFGSAKQARDAGLLKRAEALALARDTKE